jgi:hypothetical protein
VTRPEPAARAVASTPRAGRVAAAALVAYPLLIFGYWLLFPAYGKSGATAILRAIDGHATQTEVADVFAFAGAFLAVPASLALMSLFARHRSRIGWLGGLLSAVGWIALVGILMLDVVAIEIVQASGPTAGTIHLYHDLLNSPLTLILDVLATLHVVGGVLIGIGLIRTHLVGLAAAFVATLAPAVHLASNIAGALWLDEITWIALAVVYALVARTLLTNRRDVRAGCHARPRRRGGKRWLTDAEPAGRLSLDVVDEQQLVLESPAQADGGGCMQMVGDRVTMRFPDRSATSSLRSCPHNAVDLRRFCTAAALVVAAISDRGGCCWRAAATGITAPAGSPLPQGDASDGERCEWISPPPAEECVRAQADQKGDGEVRTEEILGAFGDGGARAQLLADAALGAREQRHSQRGECRQADPDPACLGVVAADQVSARLNSDVDGKHEEGARDQLLGTALGPLAIADSPPREQPHDHGTGGHLDQAVQAEADQRDRTGRDTGNDGDRELD